MYKSNLTKQFGWDVFIWITLSYICFWGLLFIYAIISNWTAIWFSICMGGCLIGCLIIAFVFVRIIDNLPDERDDGYRKISEIS